MSGQQLWHKYFMFSILSLALTGCASQMSQSTAENTTGLPAFHGEAPYSNSYDETKYASLLPQTINAKGRVILVDPKAHAWGAYRKGQLIRAGIASAGANFCKDVDRPCRTSVGTFRIYSLGNQDCISHQYPVGKGGSLMPYCMFFNKGQSLHGSPDQMMVEDNISHGCVHMRIPDAEWMRYNFAEIGTKVIILPYAEAEPMQTADSE